MKIDFLKTTRIAKSELLKARRINLPHEIQESASERNNSTHGIAKSVDTIITELWGTFSKEDLSKVDNYTKILNSSNLLDERISLVTKVLNIINNRLGRSLEDGKKLLFVPQNISAEAKNTVRDNLLRLYAIKEINNKGRKYVSPIPFHRLFNTNLETQNSNFPHSIFQHPRDKAIDLIGSLIKEDYDEIKEKEAEFATLDEQEQLIQKAKILKTLHKYFSEPESDFNGTFSGEQLENIRKLVIEHDALNNNLNKRGIYTKEAEKFFYRTKLSKEMEIGSYINGLGLVINTAEIKQNNGTKIPTVIIFSNNRSFNSFRMYDFKRLTEMTSQEQEKEALISEIEFKLIPSGYYLVGNFRNYNTKKYPNAGKMIGLQLMKLLVERDCKPIELEALAFAGNKHSPVNYYRYFGFKPISHTQEDIEKILEENNGVFPYDIPVRMRMESLEEVKKRIELIEKST